MSQVPQVPLAASPIRLTQYSHGAGCGCKISPKVLDVILAGSGAQDLDARLWVGNASRDDAAVYGLDGGGHGGHLRVLRDQGCGQAGVLSGAGQAGLWKLLPHQGW